MGVSLRRTPEYEAKKARLSPDRLLFLELFEEDIAANPDRGRNLIEDLGVLFDFTDEPGVGLGVGFRRLGRYEVELVQFRYFDEN